MSLLNVVLGLLRNSSLAKHFVFLSKFDICSLNNRCILIFLTQSEQILLQHLTPSPHLLQSFFILQTSTTCHLDYIVVSSFHTFQSKHKDRCDATHLCVTQNPLCLEWGWVSFFVAKKSDENGGMGDEWNWKNGGGKPSCEFTAVLISPGS